MSPQWIGVDTIRAVSGRGGDGESAEMVGADYLAVRGRRHGGSDVRLDRGVGYCRCVHFEGGVLAAHGGGDVVIVSGSMKKEGGRGRDYLATRRRWWGTRQGCVIEVNLTENVPKEQVR